MYRFEQNLKCLVISPVEEELSLFVVVVVVFFLGEEEIVHMLIFLKLAMISTSSIFSKANSSFYYLFH